LPKACAGCVASDRYSSSVPAFAPRFQSVLARRFPSLTFQLRSGRVLNPLWVTPAADHSAIVGGHSGQHRCAGQGLELSRCVYGVTQQLRRKDAADRQERRETKSKYQIQRTIRRRRKVSGNRGFGNRDVRDLLSIQFVTNTRLFTLLRVELIVVAG